MEWNNGNHHNNQIILFINRGNDMLNKIKQKIFFYRYSKKLRARLSAVYSTSDVEKIMDILHIRFDELIAENPSATNSEIHQYLNSLGDFVQSGIQNADIEDIENKITNTAYAKKKTSIISIAVIVIFIFFLTLFVSDVILIKQTTPVREEIIIE